MQAVKEEVAVDEAEAARRLNVSINTLRAWRKAGKAPPHRHEGRTIRYSVDALRRWVEGN